MLRFYLVAALVVCTLGAILAARHWASTKIQIAAVPASGGTPTVERSQPPVAVATAGVHESAAWVLSALPECARPEWFARNSDVATLLAKLPRVARPAGPGPFSAGNCSVRVTGDRIDITRGEDRLSVPQARLYRDDRFFYVLTTAGTAPELHAYTFLPSHA